MSVLIKPRRIRHSSKFSSRIRGASRQRQEYAASVYSMAIVQAILSVALALAGIRAYQAIDAHMDGIPIAAKVVLPVVLMAGAFMTGRACVRNFGSAREMWRTRKRSRPEPE